MISLSHSFVRHDRRNKRELFCFPYLKLYRWHHPLRVNYCFWVYHTGIGIPRHEKASCDSRAP